MGLADSGASHDQFQMAAFSKRSHFNVGTLVLSICIKLCDIEELMAERGVRVDHATINRWVIYYAPLLEEKFRGQYKKPVGSSWRMDESVLQQAA